MDCLGLKNKFSELLQGNLALQLDSGVQGYLARAISNLGPLK